MSVEIEKKYRLNPQESERVLQKLREIGANFAGEDFEENTIFAGGFLSFKNCALRLRKTESKTVLTYKERIPTENSIKHQIEFETEIADAEEMLAILGNLGYRPALVYEKRRRTWNFEAAEIVLDELPFGLFMEIEAAENDILKVEKLLEIEDLIAETKTYPRLALEFGEAGGDVVEARFK